MEKHQKKNALFHPKNVFKLKNILNVTLFLYLHFQNQKNKKTQETLFLVHKKWMKIF